MNVEPTTGSAPPGRNSLAVAGKSLNRAWLASVCERNVSSTVKPSRASRSAGRSTEPRRLLPQVSSAVCQVAGVPGVPDAQAAGDGVVEGERLAVLQEQPRVRGERGGLAAVDGVHLAGLRVVVDEVAAAADARGVRLGDAERRGRGDGGVHRVAALAQDLDAGGGGVRVDAGDRAAVADGERHLLRGRAWASDAGEAGGAAAPTVTSVAATASPERFRRLRRPLTADSADSAQQDVASVPPVNSRPRSVTSVSGWRQDPLEQGSVRPLACAAHD